MEIFKGLLLTVLALGLLLALTFSLNLFGFANYSFFAPKINQVQTNVFKQSQAYNDGMANDLGDLKIQYLDAKSQEQRDAIRAIIMQRFASYDKSSLPPDLQSFYNSL